MAFALAYMQQLSPTWFPTRGYCGIDLADLQVVTRGKKQSSTVIRHLCGNIWCANPFHLEVSRLLQPK